MTNAASQKADLGQIATRRFGLGARPGELRMVASDPRGYVVKQLSNPKSALLIDPELPSSDIIFRNQRKNQDLIKRGRDTEARSMTPSSSIPFLGQTKSTIEGTANTTALNSMLNSDSPMQSAVRSSNEKPKAQKQYQELIYETEAAARFARWASTDTPFLERLVAFWMNHFSVSIGKNGFVTAATGAFEREAIRPHILGNFETMVLAVEQHPVMLIYLDNNLSVGPNSRGGIKGARGLNENLAREVLELHTLGVDGGYTQADVTALARALTGWVYADPANDDVFGGKFRFAPNRHEPGDVTILGKTYPDGEKEQGEAALRDFARHRATAHHIATKLARAFVSDHPPATLVSRLQTAFLKSGGDLAVVTRVLVEAPEAWGAPNNKILSPFEFVASSVRAADVPPDPRPLLNALNALGGALWKAPSPNGYPIDSATWLAPENIIMRLDVSYEFAHRARIKLAPEDLATSVLGSQISAETHQAMMRAESREQALALLFMSPEFQRR